MEVDEPRRRPFDEDFPTEMADKPREVGRESPAGEAADEPRGLFSGPLPYDPDLSQPVQEEADEPRKQL